MRIGSFGEVRRRGRVYGPLPIIGGGGTGGLRPQDVFAATTFNGASPGVPRTSGVDLTQGGTLWAKDRTSATIPHLVTSVARGTDNYISTNAPGAEAAGLGATVSTTGFTIATAADPWVAWSFKKIAKFYTEFVYTGNGTAGRALPHDLAGLVGFMGVKRLDTTSSWPSFHTSATGDLFLNTTAAQTASRAIITAADATTFTVSSNADINASGGTYLARLWSHDPDTTNGIIQCGSGNVTLPWVPQWVLYTDAGSTGNWTIIDSARGFTLGLNPNLPNAEAAASGATVSGSTLTFTGMTTPIWVAIRAPV